ncbi:protein lin-52 homolog isoform X3 [Phyllostomus hastatus]|nr:protein lin-52 homolog isoform X2 [Phyllostomus hastatus]XP_045679809.1 protein lin-52 homolog isoform X3 [Phyllostomus hastatus]
MWKVNKTLLEFCWRSTSSNARGAVASTGGGARQRLPYGGETRWDWELEIGFLFGGVACGFQLSRRRLATSRDVGWKMASPTEGTDLEASLLSFEKLDRASPDLWPEQLPGVAEFAASFKSPITSSPPKWMAEIERDDIDMLKELGSLTTANLMEKVRGLQNLAYQLGLDE